MYSGVEQQQIFSQKAALLIEEVSQKVLERNELVKITILAIFSKQHMFLIGKPGVGKTYLASIMEHAIENANYFEYLIRAGTKPEELFGTMITDESGEMVYNIKNSVVDSHIVFLDELFKGKSEILNSLLGITSENRSFEMRGYPSSRVPLGTLFGASNEFPKDEDLEAFDDRLLFRYEVKSINSENFKRLILEQYDVSKGIENVITLEDIEEVKQMAKAVHISDGIVEFYVHLRQKLLQDKVKISDRKFSTAMKVLKVSAYLNNRQEVNLSDILLLRHMAWNNYVAKGRVYETLQREIFGEERNIESSLQKIEENLQKMLTQKSIYLDSFMLKTDVVTLENLEAYYELKMKDLKQLIANVTELYKEISFLYEKYEENLYKRGLIEENLFLVEEKERVFTPSIMEELERLEEAYKKLFKELTYFESECDTLKAYQELGRG